jgi:hypothetical protein
MWNGAARLVEDLIAMRNCPKQKRSKSVFRLLSLASQNVKNVMMNEPYIHV